MEAKVDIGIWTADAADVVSGLKVSARCGRRLCGQREKDNRDNKDELFHE